MNIFYLHEDAKVAAQWHCDQHCSKMIVETAQLLSTAHRLLDGDDYADKQALYKATHKNHPSAVWVRETSRNYDWTLSLLRALCAEFKRRYKKDHKSSQLLSALSKRPRNIAADYFAEPPQCMPDEYKGPSAVDAYRLYYIGDKARFARWRHGNQPDWWPRPKRRTVKLKMSTEVL